ncbi:hypothetical protein [Planctomicrobium piriforme]|uniref:Uncharacterized protein n=1 Tax=Planctomicrobium piriforme TaxID=1576369 RepID=A0A1I3CCM6_9PLAN|nr:hypothetical protein [Planctomicrobium piriforme]SFH72314.1 hypothetical protein SAMN05421753_102226 [Planctomicrobium piriforme]
MRRSPGNVKRGGWLAAGIIGLTVLFFPAFILSTWTKPASAQQDAPPQPAGPELSSSQQQLFRDYERFEKSLFDVAEQVRRKDPERAELLYRARSQSQEQNILAEMQTVAELLRSQAANGQPVSPQLGPAADRQQELVARLEAVLKVLQSLDERERVAAEIARVQELLKDTNRVIARQKDARAETQRGKNPQNSQDAQKKVNDEADRLAKKIDQQDAERNADQKSEEKKSDGSDSEPKSPDDKSQKPGENGKPSPSKPEKSKPGDSPSPSSPSQPSPSQPGEPQKPGEPQQGGEPSPGQQSPPQPPQPGQKQPGEKKAQQPEQKDSQKTAGREQLEQARQEMQQAIEELEQGNKDKATENQDDAVSRLEELKAQLEEILRQLREDERESYLTLLEARFQNMLKRQQHINKETLRVDAIGAEDRPRQNFASQADTLRKEQEDNALEAEKAAHLLKEEGSSVAFPEAVEQMHDNMRVVVSRLAKQETGKTTQLVEQLIVETLDEMIAALRKELEKKQDQKQQQGPQGQPGPPQDPSLVDQLAELKLIRSLQSQVNRLTKQIGTEVDTVTAGDPDQVKLIQDLRARQERIQEATYDLSVGRNQ